MARGYLTLAVVGGFVLAADLAGRLLVAPAMRLLPARRTRLLTAWMRALARAVLGILRVSGGVRADLQARIPGREGVLVIANHQSLLDIPVAVRALADSYPRIVTRRRYARGIPLISHLLALTESPLVDPDRPATDQADRLAEMARGCVHPLVIFPEGHRSRDGELRPFRRGGLGAILRARPWTVHLLVVDGLWRARRFTDLLGSMSGLRGRAVSAGPFPWPGPGGDVDAFLDAMELRMAGELARLRAGASG
jgi:1-acyl-sn-glycerol-3-phosphate acyltransferase